jgi:hypothetical protein
MIPRVWARVLARLWAVARIAAWSAQAAVAMHRPDARSTSSDKLSQPRIARRAGATSWMCTIPSSTRRGSAWMIVVRAYMPVLLLIGLAAPARHRRRTPSRYSRACQIIMTF